MRYLFFVVAPLLTAMILIHPVPSFGSEKLDFRATLKRAIEKSPDYDQLVAAEQNASLSTKNAWASMLPSLDFNIKQGVERIGGSDYYNSSNTNPHDPWASSMGFDLNEKLYDNGESLRRADIADLNRHIAQLNLRLGRNKILVSVAKAYYDFSSAVVVLNLFKQQSETLKTQFRVIDTRYRQGMSSNRDYLRIKAQVQHADISILNQTYHVQEMKETLKAAIGDSSDLDFEPYNPKAIEPATMQFPKIDPEATFDFQITHAQEKISDIQYRSAQRAYWPTLDLEGGISYVKPLYGEESIPVIDDPHYTATAMLTLKYNLWDWGTLRRNVEIENNNRRISNDTQERTRIGIRQTLINLWQNSATLTQTFKVSSQILKANEEVYNSLDRGYRDGKVNYIDLISALNELYGSRSDDITLRFNLLKVRADLALYQGNADEVLNAQ